MNGGHDLGGMHGFGPVVAERNEPVFHADWEGRVFALTLAMADTGEWTRDAMRFARESLPAPRYLSKTYYEIWLAGLQRLLLERGLVSDEELGVGRSLTPANPLARTLTPAEVPRRHGPGGPSRREPRRAPRFSVNERVRARNIHPPTHTRLPRYVRGHVGTVARVHGCHVFPDASAHARDEDPQWLYTVMFEGAELWGPNAETGTTVSVDAFEPYLEPAG